MDNNITAFEPIVQGNVENALYILVVLAGTGTVGETSVPNGGRARLTASAARACHRRIAHGSTRGCNAVS